MPAALPVIALTAGAVVIGELSLAAAAIIVASASYSALQAERQEKRAKSAAKRQREAGIRANIWSNVEPIPICYGFVKRIPGIVVFAETSKVDATRPDGNKQRLNLIVVWCEGEIAGFSQHTHAGGADDAVFIDSWTETDKTWDFEYGRVVQVSNHTGADDQAADAELLLNATYDTDLAAKWTTDHRLRGVAYSYIGLIWHPPEPRFTEVPTITANLQGPKLTHPVTGVLKQTHNPAWAILEYLLNTRYGLGFEADEIDVDSFDQAAAYCEQRVSLPGAEVAYRYELNGMIDPTASGIDNLRQMLGTCNGMLVQANGKLKLIVDKPEVPSFDLNEDNMIGEFSISLDAQGGRYNRVRAKYVSNSKQGKPDIVIVDSPAYRVNDGDQLLQLEMSLPLTVRASQASYLATLALKHSRYGTTVQCKATLEAMRCEIGDVVTITHEVPGWTAQPFRVIGITINPDETVDLTLREYNDDIYDIDDLADEEPVGTDLPDPTEVAPPTGLSLTATSTATQSGSYVYGIDVSWTASPDGFLAGYRIEYERTEFVGTSYVTISNPDATTQTLSGLADGTGYTVRVYAVNALGALSDPLTGTVTTLQDDEPADEALVTSELVPDVNITTSWLWAIGSGSAWEETGGPNGKPCITLRGGTGSNQATPSYRGVYPVIKATANEFQFWVTARKNNATGNCKFKVRIPSIPSTGSPSSIAASADYEVDMASYPAGRWVALGPFTIGPFDDPTSTSFPYPHYMYVNLVPTTSDTDVSLSSLLIERV